MNLQNQLKSLALLFILLMPFSLFAQSHVSTMGNNINWLYMLMQMAGGLALFLYGMEKMTEALKAVAGEKMKFVLEKLTRNRFSAAASGAFVTSVIQSSSITTVLVVGFVSAGIMTFSNAIGVIMGANIGTTITAQIIAFKVEQAALGMIAIGFAMTLLSHNTKIKHNGAMLMGLGLLFLGMGTMSEAMKPLRTFEPFINLLTHVNNPILALIVAAAFTALIQSSSATTGIVIVMASQGFISLPLGILLALGANIGTCVTAILAALGKSRDAIRVAGVHVLFNVIGALLWLPFVDYLAQFVMHISPSFEQLNGSDRLAKEVPRQIANAHTIFNIINTLLFIGFTNHVAKLLTKWLPDERQSMDLIDIKYLDETLISTPSLALDRVQLEAQRLVTRVNKQLLSLADIADDAQKRKRMLSTHEEIVILNQKIHQYLSLLRQQALSPHQNNDFIRYLHTIDAITTIDDIVREDLVNIIDYARANNLQASEEMREMIIDLYNMVTTAINHTLEAVLKNNQRLAQETSLLSHQVNQFVEKAFAHQSVKLVTTEEDRIANFRLEMKIIEKLQYIYNLCERLASSVLNDKRT